MTAKEEVLETILLWIATQERDLAASNWDEAATEGYGYALNDLTELLDSL